MRRPFTTPAQAATDYELGRWHARRHLRTRLVRAAHVCLALVGIGSVPVIVALVVHAPFAAGVLAACDVLLIVLLAKANAWRLRQPESREP